MKHLLRFTGWLLTAVFSSSVMAAPAGELDTTFGDGWGHTSIGFDIGGSWHDAPKAMADGPAGSRYLVGTVELDSMKTGIGLTRLHHDGTLDISFGVNGRAVHDGSWYGITVNDAALQADGKIVVAGSSLGGQPLQWRMMACRFHASGVIDTTFGQPQTPGCRTVPTPIGDHADARSILIQPNGRIVLAGYAEHGQTKNNQAAVIRLLSDGAPDAGFGNQGIANPGFRVVFTKPDSPMIPTDLYDVARTPAGKLVFAGTVDPIDPVAQTDGKIVQLNEINGSLDTSFNEGHGHVNFRLESPEGQDDVATSIAVYPDGDLVVAGYTDIGPGKTVPLLARFEASGLPFPDFGENGVRFYDTCTDLPCIMTPFDLRIMGGGRLLLAGTSEENGPRDFFLLRLHSNGDPDVGFGPGDGFDDGVARVDIAGNSDFGYRVSNQGARILVAGASSIAGHLDFAVARLDHGIDTTFTVSTESTPGGSITAAGDHVVAHSDQLDFTVTPDPGYSLVQVSGCGVTFFQGVYTTAPATADCTVTAQFSADLVLRYTVDPNGSILGDSLQTIPFGDDGKPVEAIANFGYQFSHWNDDVLDNPRQDTGVTANIDVTAVFAVNVYQAAPNPGPNGALSPAETQMVPHGNTVHFTVQPDPGFVIGELSGCPGELVGNVFLTDPILIDCKLNVSFVPSNAQFLLHYLADLHGTVVGDVEQMVLAGADGTPVTAVPDDGYQFLMWKDGVTDNPRQDTHVVADIEVNALFAPETLMLVTPSAGPGGTISPDTVQVVDPGKYTDFTLTPAPGHTILGVAGTCGGTLAGNVFTTAEIVANCTVIASFSAEGTSGNTVFNDDFED